MSPVDGEECSGEGIPDLDSAIPTAGGNIITIGRPGERTDNVGVSFIDGDNGSCISIPDLDGAVPTGRGDVLAVRRPGDCVYIIAMLCESDKRASFWGTGLDSGLHTENQKQGQYKRGDERSGQGIS